MNVARNLTDAQKVAALDKALADPQSDLAERIAQIMHVPAMIVNLAIPEGWLDEADAANIGQQVFDRVNAEYYGAQQDAEDFDDDPDFSA